MKKLQGRVKTNTPQAERRRKMVAVTLSDEEREKLTRLSLRYDESKSAIIGRLIRGAPE